MTPCGRCRAQVAFPWSRVRVDVFMIEHMAIGFPLEMSVRKHMFMDIYLPLMGYRHVEYIGNLDDIYVRNDIQL